MHEPYYVAPVYTGVFNRHQRAMIAGFLLHHRAQVLSALQSLSDPATLAIPEWAGPTRAYYEAAEAYSRKLLWEIGYPVDKNQMYGELLDAYNP